MELTEYVALRNELLHNFTSTNQFFTLAVTVTAALLGYALQNKRRNWMVFLTPFAILVPSIWLILAQIKSVLRIATYIQVFWETAHQGLQWETRLMDFREMMPYTDRAYTYAVGYAYGALGSVSLLLSFLHIDVKNKTNLYTFIGVSVFLIGALGYPLLQIMHVLPDQLSEYIGYWKKVKQLSQPN